MNWIRFNGSLRRLPSAVSQPPDGAPLGEGTRWVLNRFLSIHPVGHGVIGIRMKNGGAACAIPPFENGVG
jgi:hypothetical protein